ncbi:RapZ C-terminal domain-containing protein [Embleya sp. NPDC001921]
MTNHSPARVIRVVSFGYGHADAPEAEITLDLRRRFRNPHGDPAMRYRTGLDEDVFEHVLDTPGVRDLAAVIALAAHDLAHAVPGPIIVACGCIGGRHRSVAVARHIADILGDGCSRIEIEHRDVHRPVLPSADHTETDPACQRCKGDGYEWYTARDGEFHQARCSKCRDGRVGR